jgi:SAM-dependent methyltransferase
MYGTKPNQYYAEQLNTLPAGKILLPAEGEGRNAIYAAKKGWDVYAFDYSTEAYNKAIKLAALNNVRINYLTHDITQINYPPKSFDLIAIVYLHLFPNERIPFHKSMLSLLKPGGKIIAEYFSKNQINRNTGGPKDINLLYNVSAIYTDFKILKDLKITETILFLDEGKFHHGKASVIRLSGTLP